MSIWTGGLQTRRNTNDPVSACVLFCGMGMGDGAGCVAFGLGCGSCASSSSAGEPVKHCQNALPTQAKTCKTKGSGLWSRMVLRGGVLSLVRAADQARAGEPGECPRTRKASERAGDLPQIIGRPHSTSAKPRPIQIVRSPCHTQRSMVPQSGWSQEPWSFHCHTTEQKPPPPRLLLHTHDPFPHARRTLI